MDETFLQTPEGTAVPAPVAPTPPYIAMLDLLWQRRSLLVLSGAAGLVLATILAFTIPKRYKSTTQLMPPDSQSISSATLADFATSTIPSALSGAAGSLLGTKTQGATFLGILTSRTVQDDLINQFDLRRVYHMKRYVDTRKKLAERTSIDEDKKTGNITIAVTDSDPYRARDLTAGYTAELNKLISQLSTSSARRERIFLEGRLKSIKEDLDSASRDLSQFSSRNATLDVQSEGKTMLESVGKVQQELISKEGELRSLRASLGPDNVRVRSAEAGLAELRSQLRQLTGSNNENSDALAPRELYPSVRKLPLLGSTYTDLYRKVTLQEAVFEMLTKQYEIAKVQEAKEIPSVKVLDPPDLPEKKSFPPRLLIMLIGSFLAMAFAGAWVVFERSWSGLSANDPRKKFLINVLTTSRIIALRKERVHFGFAADKTSRKL